jgi:ceramide glucosyltransferase
VSWQIANAVLLAIALAGAAYLALAACCLAAYARKPLEVATEFLPNITVLKPIAGNEAALYENIASFCEQDYEAPYEVIFCLRDAGDSAREAVERVVAAHPDVRTRIAIGYNPAMANPKIANLAKLGAEPQGEIVVIADSDVRVGRDYLRAFAACFASERVGAVTCLYGAMPNATLVSRLGALYIEDGFMPSVLVALALGKLRFCLGASMAVRRRVLEAIGGLAALGSHLADDHGLGGLVSRKGYEIYLSRYVVRTMIPETTLGALWSHELRWARTNFALAPAGYAFSFLMYALPFALLYLAVSRDWVLGLSLLGLIAALRLAVHYLARKALAVERSDDLLLVPLRDFLSLGLWVASLFGRRVRWRERTYTLDGAESG